MELDQSGNGDARKTSDGMSPNVLLLHVRTPPNSVAYPGITANAGYAELE